MFFNIFLKRKISFASATLFQSVHSLIFLQFFIYLHILLFFVKFNFKPFLFLNVKFYAARHFGGSILYLSKIWYLYFSFSSFLQKLLMVFCILMLFLAYYLFFLLCLKYPHLLEPQLIFLF